MMKKLLFTLCIALVLTACESTKNIDTLKKAANDAEKSTNITIPKANSAQILIDIEYLANDDLNGRNTGSKDIDTAANYLAERFADMGIMPYKGSYMDHFKAKDLDATNIVAVIPGIDKDLMHEFVVIGAHYDHIGVLLEAAVDDDNIANGANDNATGTATVMALAESLKQLNMNKRTLVFALFSAEELGLLGSMHLAQAMQKEAVDVVAMINFEMTGIPMQNRPYLTYITGHDVSNMAAVFNATYEERLVTGKLEQAATFNLFKRSDNYPFFQVFNIPSQTFSTFDFTNFEHYHKVGDEISEINITHMAEVVDALMPGILEVVNGKKLILSPSADK